jgi:hypothetical protein
MKLILRMNQYELKAAHMDSYYRFSRSTPHVVAKDESMIGRIAVTAIALLIAGTGFFAVGETGGMIFCAFGILFLLLSMAIWFVWSALRRGLGSGETDRKYADYPIERR